VHAGFMWIFVERTQLYNPLYRKPRRSARLVGASTGWHRGCKYCASGGQNATTYTLLRDRPCPLRLPRKTMMAWMPCVLRSKRCGLL
jgi:hypothetical protein